MDKKIRVQMYDIIRRPSRFTPEGLMEYGILVPENLKGLETVLVEEFAVVSENKKQYVLISDFEKGIVRTNTTREVREISTQRYQTMMLNLQEMFFTNEERVKGVPFESLEIINKQFTLT